MLALARKYRPRNFATVAVQSHVANTLKGAIARGRVAHGYLLCGPRGVGKTTLARVLAMALNCERRARGPVPPDETNASDASVPDEMRLARDAGEPCGECDSCRRIWSGSASLDVVEIDAASNRGVDDARDLRERALYAPSGDDRYKVYIVDEAHMLTREAWNALLKVLEEPPPRVVFVFATTEPQKIAQAAAPVLSRLQRFDFKRIGPADVRERLATVLAQEHVSADPEALSILARAADGSMRDALSLTDQALALGDGSLSVEHVREALGLVAEDEYIALLDLVAERRAGDAFATIGRLAEEGVDLGGFLAGFGDMLRAQLSVVLGAGVIDVSDGARHALEERKDRLSAGDLLRMLGTISELEPRFRRSAQQQLLLETLLVRFALLDRTIEIEEVLRGLAGGDPGGSSAARERPVPPSRPTGVGRSPSTRGDVLRDASIAVPATGRSSHADRESASDARADAGQSGAGDGVPSARGSSQDVAGADPGGADPGGADPGGADPRRSGGGGPPQMKVRSERPESPHHFTAESIDPTRSENEGATAVASLPAVTRPRTLAEPSARATAIDPSASPSSRAETAIKPSASQPPRSELPELNAIVERWDDVAATLREAGRQLIAAMVERALPVGVSASGVVTLEVDNDETTWRAMESARDELLDAVRARFAGVTRVALVRADRAAPALRLTDAALREQRVASLRKRDPVLSAAIDELDLELLD